MAEDDPRLAGGFQMPPFVCPCCMSVLVIDRMKGFWPTFTEVVAVETGISAPEELHRVKVEDMAAGLLELRRRAQQPPD